MALYDTQLVRTAYDTNVYAPSAFRQALGHNRPNVTSRPYIQRDDAEGLSLP